VTFQEEIQDFVWRIIENCVEIATQDPEAIKRVLRIVLKKQNA
jgi:hypothetical protein